MKREIGFSGAVFCVANTRSNRFKDTIFSGTEKRCIVLRKSNEKSNLGGCVDLYQVATFSERIRTRTRRMLPF